MNRRTALMLLASAMAANCAHDGALQQADVAGEPLHFLEAGAGPPLILVHGGLQDYRLWLPTISAFAERRRVIAYSRRNHFPGAVSPDGAPDGAADLHAQDLAGLLTALGEPVADIVAHSAGAHAALFFAHAYPERTRTLSINEPPAAGMLLDVHGGPELARAFSETLAPARAAFRSGDLETGLRRFADAVGGPGEYERRGENERRMMRDNAAAHIADAKTNRPRPVFTSAMAREMGVRTLLTNGTRSPDFFQRICDRLGECLPRVERASMTGASHTVPSERPAAFAAAILDFIARA